MDFKQEYTRLFNEGKQLIIEPRKFWKTKMEAIDDGDVFVRFFLPLALLVGVAIFLGELITSAEFLFSYAFFKSLREVFVYLLQFYAAAILTNELLTSFGGVKNRPMVRIIIAYSLFPFLLVSALTGLFPGLYILEVVGLYGIILFVLGVNTCLQIPGENRTWYILIAILLNLLTFGLVNFFSWQLLQAFYPYGA